MTKQPRRSRRQVADKGPECIQATADDHAESETAPFNNICSHEDQRDVQGHVHHGKPVHPQSRGAEVGLGDDIDGCKGDPESVVGQRQLPHNQPKRRVECCERQ